MAPMIMPLDATIAAVGLLAKAPSRMRNSPMKPLVPGRPMEANVKTMNRAENIGITPASPP
ncbi:hypothetical protein MBAV_004163 [Candidatus Magnetobacterium bavaricum]|uniref:Uncharacterized protein n=1 Tax=Candidatus Magnetobacterium bavaricum TaxID=29290 RepID=A0A0F3GSH4_9BACT|nr:hypothetical protein MBAV_004163 [Candidatus Magnetobacterium bavaricum]